MASLIRKRTSSQYQSSLSSSMSSRSAMTPTFDLDSISDKDKRQGQKQGKEQKHCNNMETILIPLGFKWSNNDYYRRQDIKQEQNNEFYESNETYTPQKNPSLMKEFQSSFSTKREGSKNQQDLREIRGNLFGAPTKVSQQSIQNQLSAKHSIQLPEITHKNNYWFRNRVQDNFQPYTIPKITSRVLTYDQCSQQQDQQKLTFLRRIVSQKVNKHCLTNQNGSYSEQNLQFAFFHEEGQAFINDQSQDFEELQSSRDKEISRRCNEESSQEEYFDPQGENYDDEEQSYTTDTSDLLQVEFNDEIFQVVEPAQFNDDRHGLYVQKSKLREVKLVSSYDLSEIGEESQRNQTTKQTSIQMRSPTLIVKNDTTNPTSIKKVYSLQHPTCHI